MKVAADVGQLDEARRLVAEGRLAQLGRAPRHAERGVERHLVGRVRQRAERVDVRAAPGRANELGAEAARFGRDQLDRNALDGDADRAPVRALDDGDDLWQALERVERGCRVGGRDDDRELRRRVDPAPRVARELAAERGSDVAEQAAGLGQRQAASWLRLAALRQPVEHLPLGGRADPGHVVQPARERGCAELVRRAHVERGADLEHALRAEPDQPAEADQLRPQLALQLVELRDPAGLDELLEPRRDARPDPAQLAHAAGADEVVDGHGRRPHRLGRPAVGPRGVEPGAREVEQRGEGLQPLRDHRVVEPCGHGRSLPRDGVGRRIAREQTMRAMTVFEAPPCARLRPDPRLRGDRRRAHDGARRARRLDRLAVPAGRRLAVGLRAAARRAPRRLRSSSARPSRSRPSAPTRTGRTCS